MSNITFRKKVIETITRNIIQEIVNKQKLSVHEMIHILGQLCYSVGASLEGHKGVGPNVEELKRALIQDPENIGNALMATGLQIQTWTQDLRIEDKEEEK